MVIIHQKGSVPWEAVSSQRKYLSRRQMKLIDDLEVAFSSKVTLDEDLFASYRLKYKFCILVFRTFQESADYLPSPLCHPQSLDPPVTSYGWTVTDPPLCFAQVGSCTHNAFLPSVF